MDATQLRLWSSCTCALALGACFSMKDRRDHDPPDLPAPLRPSGLTSEGSVVCRLLGPGSRDEGIYGTDLGYTTPLPGTDRLAVLFGDTWSEAGDACQYPVSPNDDLQATLPFTRPDQLQVGEQSADERSAACATLGYTLDDASDPKSWRRIRLFESAEARSAGTSLETGALRTPVAAWTAGEQLYTLFSRGDLAPCEASSECPQGMACSNDAEAGVAIGRCLDVLPLGEEPISRACDDQDDCGVASTCDLEEAPSVCFTQTPFELELDGEPRSPDWYRQDPDLGTAQTMYVARAAWPERPEDYLVAHRFVTHRFVNVAARTVAHFDPGDPSQNDYRPGDHTLLLWGRPSFVGGGGVQSLPFLLYVPLAELTDAAEPRWAPRFFAGYDADGAAEWSEHEEEAVPIYGTEAELEGNEDEGAEIEWREPEHDYVNQMSVVYLEPLQRFVMLYGGDVPAWLVADEEGVAREPEHQAQVPGAIQLRSARHPWGRADLDAPDEHAWSSPQAALTREVAAPYLACGDGGEDELPGCTDEGDANSPLDLLATIASVAVDEPSETLDVAGMCIEGSAALAGMNAVSGDPVGRLYGVNVIEPWTADVSEQTHELAEGERALELYFNVSTWNPYQVALMKTHLRGAPLEP
jgi:hypothetical protein